MLHWLYPSVCELCHEPCEHNLCPACAERLPRVPAPICLYCGAPVAGEQVDAYHCRACTARPRHFDFARSALARSEEALALIYRLKYHRANYLAPALAGMLNSLWESTPGLLAHGDWVLVPVPAGAEHLFARGYNQAEELACALGRLRGLRVCAPLVRQSTAHESQTRLSAGERWRNALQAYTPLPAWSEGRKRLPQRVVLVDDVYTTGSTARACARALKSLPGVECVAVLTLMRAT